MLIFILLFLIIANASVTNTAYKVVKREATVEQTIVTNSYASILFGTVIKNELPTTLLVSTSANGGSLFTCAVKPLRLMVFWSFRLNSYATQPTAIQTFVMMSTSPILYGQNQIKYSYVPTLSGSCIIELAVGDTFQVYIYIDFGSSVKLSSGSGHQATSLQIYSLL